MSTARSEARGHVSRDLRGLTKAQQVKGKGWKRQPRPESSGRGDWAARRRPGGAGLRGSSAVTAVVQGSASLGQQLAQWGVL